MILCGNNVCTYHQASCTRKIWGIKKVVICQQQQQRGAATCTCVHTACSKMMHVYYASCCLTYACTVHAYAQQGGLNTNKHHYATEVSSNNNNKYTTTHTRTTPHTLRHTRGDKINSLQSFFFAHFFFFHDVYDACLSQNPHVYTRAFLPQGHCISIHCYYTCTHFISFISTHPLIQKPINSPSRKHHCSKKHRCSTLHQTLTHTNAHNTHWYALVSTQYTWVR